MAPLPQVIDGFFVKRTADIKESAAYLALLTRGLQRLYQVSRLHRALSARHRPLTWVLCSREEGEQTELPGLRLAPP